MKVSDCQRLSAGAGTLPGLHTNRSEGRMAFKAAVETIIGKTVKHVVVKEGSTPPQSQVFLVFTDDTYYEFYATYGTMSGAALLP